MRNNQSEIGDDTFTAGLQDKQETHNEQPQDKAKVIKLRPPARWHDPLQLIQEEGPSQISQVVLWVVATLILILLAWAAIGRLDIIATAEGKLASHTLVKIVQPAESGVVKQLLVHEGDSVKEGQVLARLDTTLATADKTSITNDLNMQYMQARRIEAELLDKPMLTQPEDDPQYYAHVLNQYTARRRAYLDALDQEKSSLIKMEHERKSAGEVAAKLEQTIPTYKKTADAYASLEKEGYMSGLASAEKQRDWIEKIKDLDAQKANVLAMNAAISAQQKRIAQIQSNYKSSLEEEVAQVRAKIAQLQPNLDKTIYREALMELRAPQDGVIKDLATTTVGAVVQPGTVVMTLVPKGESLYADVEIKNDDVGFVRVGQTAQIKLAAYPFQKYGMLTGTVMRISADASDPKSTGNANSGSQSNSESNTGSNVSTYKARLKLDQQFLTIAGGAVLAITPGMQAVAEINQGTRTVLEYLLSPVHKVVQEAAREK